MHNKKHLCFELHPILHSAKWLKPNITNGNKREVYYLNEIFFSLLLKIITYSYVFMKG